MSNYIRSAARVNTRRFAEEITSDRQNLPEKRPSSSVLDSMVRRPYIDSMDALHPDDLEDKLYQPRGATLLVIAVIAAVLGAGAGGGKMRW